MTRSKKFTAEQLQEIARIQEREGITRKSAVRKYRQLQSKVKKAKRNVESLAQDFKRAAAHDVEIPEVKLPAKNASLVAKGAAYHVLAGRPAKQAVVAVFGKSGYALSWVTRAERLGVSPQDLCEAFRLSPTKVADQWAALEAK